MNSSLKDETDESQTSRGIFEFLAFSFTLLGFLPVKNLTPKNRVF